MDLWQLKIFVKVVETKSFSKASEDVHLSQPTVSSHIKDLEEYFGCRLIDRLGKISVPTKIGQILYDYSKQILALKDQAQSTIDDYLGNKQGSMIIGGSTIPSGYIIPKLIGPFIKKYPNISIEVSTGDTFEVIQDIEKGKVEIGIVGASVSSPNIYQERLIKDKMMLILPGDHRLAHKTSLNWAELKQESFIAREKGSGTWQAISGSISRNGYDYKDLNIAVTFGSTASVIQGILNNVGISILSTISVQDDLAAGRLKAVAVGDIDPDRYFYLTYHSKRTLSPICRKWVEFAKEFCRNIVIE